MENKSPIKPVPVDKIRDFLVDVTVEKTSIDKHIVEKVVDFQWKTAYEATRINWHIELSGFCRFALSYNKIKTKIKNLETLISKVDNMREKYKNSPEKLKNVNSAHEYNKKQLVTLYRLLKEKEERDQERLVMAEKNKEKILKARKAQQIREAKKKEKLCSENLQNI